MHVLTSRVENSVDPDQLAFDLDLQCFQYKLYLVLVWYDWVNNGDFCVCFRYLRRILRTTEYKRGN